MITAIVINLVTALLFMGMYGVGAAIAIGVVALPIMMSQGIPARVAAPAFTMGVGAGMFVNPALFGTFKPLFPGIQYEAPWLTLWAIGMAVYVLCAWLMIYVNLRRLGVRHAASVDVAEPAPLARKRTPYYTYLVPLVPVLMIIGFNWAIIPTFLVSIVLALVLTWKDRTLPGATSTCSTRRSMTRFPTSPPSRRCGSSAA